MDASVWVVLSSNSSSWWENDGFISFGDKHCSFDRHGISDSDFALDLCLDSPNISVILFVCSKSRNHQTRGMLPLSAFGSSSPGDLELSWLGSEAGIVWSLERRKSSYDVMSILQCRGQFSTTSGHHPWTESQQSEGGKKSTEIRCWRQRKTTSGKSSRGHQTKSHQRICLVERT